MSFSYITLCLKYGGRFVDNGNGLEYEGGNCREIYPIDIDTLCYFELKWYAKSIGLLDMKACYYQVPGLILSNGLRKVEDDNDAIRMIECAKKSDRLYVYFDHVVDHQKLVIELPRLESKEISKALLTFQPLIQTQESSNDPLVNVHIPLLDLQQLNPLLEKEPNSPQLCSIKQGKRKVDIDLGDEIVNDLEYEVVDDLGDEFEVHDADDFDDEFEEEATNIDVGIPELDTTDDEWDTIKAKYYDFDKQHVKKKERERELQKAMATSMRNGINVEHKEAEAPTENEDGYHTEYENSDEEMVSDDSDDDTPRLLRKKRKHMKVDKYTNFKTLKWTVGMTIASSAKFKEAITKFALAQGYDLRISRSDNQRKRYAATCKKGCDFKVYASWDKKDGNYKVRSVVDHHICTRNMLKNRQLKSSWLAKHYLLNFKEKLQWPAKEIMTEIKKDFGVCIAQSVAYSIKYGAHMLLHGSMKDHYRKIGSYLLELHKSNKGTFMLYINPTIQASIPVFQRFFVLFEGIKQGLINGCRRVLCIDACFLKTFFGGCLLAAVGMDGNNNMFPIAWAVAEGENNDSWEWFMSNLRECLGGTNGEGWTLISDEHKSIIRSISTVFPNCEHRHCARHIYANWKKTHKGEDFKGLFWTAAKAYNQADFKCAFMELKNASPKAAEDFSNQNPALFCRAFIKTETKCDVIVNNMAETFNAYIVSARTKHVIYMLEEIRVALMERRVVKRNLMKNAEDEVCPRIRAKLEIEIEESRNCVPQVSSDIVFQVSHFHDSVKVDLNTRTCTCRKWDLTGIPCCHAIACLAWLNMTSYDSYVHHYFKKACYLKAYEMAIEPCVGERHWPECELQLDPPQFKIGPGRPKKNRRRDPHEDPKRSGRLTKHGVIMTCGWCKKVGHNKRSCPTKPIHQDGLSSTTIPAPTNIGQPKRRAGRPRKQPTLNDVGQPEFVVETTLRGCSSRSVRGMGRFGGAIRGNGRSSGVGVEGGRDPSWRGVSGNGIDGFAEVTGGSVRGRGRPSGDRMVEFAATIVGEGRGRSMKNRGTTSSRGRAGYRGGGAGTRRGLIWWIDGGRDAANQDMSHSST